MTHSTTSPDWTVVKLDTRHAEQTRETWMEYWIVQLPSLSQNPNKSQQDRSTTTTTNNNDNNNIHVSNTLLLGLIRIV